MTQGERSSSRTKVAGRIRGGLRRGLAKSGKGWLVMRNCRETRKMSREEIGKQKKPAVRMKTFVGAMTMMILDEVEMQSGHWRTILLNESEIDHKMTENAGSGNVAEM